MPTLLVMGSLQDIAPFRTQESGSIQLVALGFCAALVVLLAIPLIEALVPETATNETAVSSEVAS